MNEEKEQKIRSSLQNKALHVGCDDLAKQMNDRGVEPVLFMKGIVLSHTMESVKEAYRSIARHMFGKNSTTQLTTQELNIINEIITRHVAQFGIEYRFPSIENQMLMKHYEKERI